MADTPNLVLEHLVALRGELRDFRTQVADDMRSLKERMTALEGAMLAQRRDALGTDENLARHQAEFDRLAERVERIERRLELHN
jgi:hypothetical protein